MTPTSYTIPNEMLKEIIAVLKEKQFKKISKDDILRLKVKLCKKYGVKKTPTDIEVLLNLPAEDLAKIKQVLITKPSRSLSGVCVVAIMSRPAQCPHAASKGANKGIGPCIMCPGGPGSSFGEVPQSYTGKEPATMRAIRNKFDSYLQVMNRLEQYIAAGHVPEKIELIIMGGTFPSQDISYQDEFVAFAFKAMNDFSDKFYDLQGRLDISRFKDFFELPGDVGDPKRTQNILAKLELLRGSADLVKEQETNEKSRIRCVGLTIETRPDYALPEHCEQMLKLGATKVELGVQTIYDSVLERISRGHTVEDSIIATRTLKDFGFKVTYHVMLGLPDSSSKMDAECLAQLFSNPDFRPDMLKIYPCMVMKGTNLYSEWKAGKFRPLGTKEVAEIIAEFKPRVPKYVRIMRVQRDIPTNATEAGVDMTNLRQLVHKIMQKKGKRCGCIRCNELSRLKTGKDKSAKFNVAIKHEKYVASGGTEYFIYAEDASSGGIVGFCRMRFPDQQLVPEITAKTALIRELHVYGTALGLNKSVEEDKLELPTDKYTDTSTQHKGYGKKLLAMAEKIAAETGKNKIVVLSGVGAREYYGRLRYKLEHDYMIKELKT